MAQVKTIDTGFRPSAWQSVFLRHSAKVKLALCGLGSGKSALGATQAAMFMTDPRVCRMYGIPWPNFGWVVGQDFPTVLNTSWREMKKFLPPGAYEANEQLHRIRIGESECQFVAADDPDSLRAGNVNWVWLDEPGIIRSDEAWRNIVGRARRGVACVVYLTGTPKGYTWLHDLVWARSAKADLLRGNEQPLVRTLSLDDIADTDAAAPGYEDYWSMRVPAWLAGRMTQGDLDRAKDELSPDWFMQEYGADFRSFTGLVYAEFSSERHIKEKLPNAVQWWGALDWGYRDPAAAILVGRDGSRFSVHDEFYRTRCDADEQIDWCLGMQAQYNTIAFVADSARADLVARARLRGLRVWSADKSPGTVAAGLEEVRRYLRNDQLLVHPRCRATIREFQTYRYSEGGKKGALENPVDADNHVLDSLRYLAWALRGTEAPKAEDEAAEVPWYLRSQEPQKELAYWRW